MYGTEFTSFELEEFFRSVAEPCAQIRTSEDVIVSKVGRELYEKFFRNYTRKQWGLDPSELDAAVTARVPVRTNRDDRYFTDTYQAMPLHGYTRMFERMLAHPNIKIMVNADYREVRDMIPHREVIFTGPIDEFFDYRFGKLPYRSLEFKFETRNVAVAQEAPVINYPNENAYTRVTEFKYLTGQEHPKTTLVYEFPKSEGDPYYPIPRPENQRCIGSTRRSRTRRRACTSWAGSAPTSTYNMDQCVAQALAYYRKVLTGDEELAIDGMRPLELWGGVECTVNRVGDRFFDQMRAVGARRPDSRTSTASPRSGSRRSAIRCCGNVWRRARCGRPTGTGPMSGSAGSARSGSARSSGCCTTAAARPTRRWSTASFPELLAALRARRRRALSLGDRLHAGQRAADDGAVQRLCTASGIRTRRDDADVRPCAAEPDARHGAGDARDPRGEPGGPADPDRGSRPRSGTPPPTAQVEHERHRRWLTWDLLTGPRRQAPSAVRLPPAGWRSRSGAAARFVERPVPAGRHRHQLLPHQRSMARRAAGGVSAAGRMAATDGSAYADVEAVRARPDGIAGHERHLLAAWRRYRRAGGADRSASRLHARRADALAGRGLARRAGRAARAAPTSARSRRGRCSGRTTGTRS